MFDAVNYTETEIHAKLKALQDHTFKTVSGLDFLENLLTDRLNSKFIAVDDTQNARIVQPGNTYFERRLYTIYILQRSSIRETNARESILEVYRSAFRSIISKIIRDKNLELHNLDTVETENIQMYEMPAAFADGCIGIYFMIKVDNPINLVYDANEWTE